MVEEDKSDPKDQETSDWTQVTSLATKSNVKAYDIETLATSKVPHNIPYLEVYRTDELYYKPYVSPYLSSGVDGTTSTGEGGDSSSGSGGEGTSLWTELSKIVWKYYPASKDKNHWINEFRNASANWTSIATVVNKMGGDKDKQNKVIQEVLDAKKKYASEVAKGTVSSAKGVGDQVYSSLKRNEKLKEELTTLVKKYYRTETHIHYSSIVKRYMNVPNNRISIRAVTETYRKHLRSGVKKSDVSTAILNTKVKYSR